jgi:hypothetical protein
LFGAELAETEYNLRDHAVDVEREGAFPIIVDGVFPVYYDEGFV